MNYSNSRSALVFSISLVSGSALANMEPPTTIGCRTDAIPAHLIIEARAWTSLDDQFQPTCPLLEEKKLRKLVGRFATGTTFAHPAIPGSCLSGTVDSGTLQFGDGNEITINTLASYTESAQRLSPVPSGQGIPAFSGQGDVNLFAGSDDGTLQAGAAMTAIHLEGEDSDEDDLEFDLLLDDHLLVTWTGEDTEDFLIVGSKGDYKVSGRLTGRGQIISAQPLGIQFFISGDVCLKQPRED